uniref:Uncharacterized protein n=1 Tax=Megaselia scalaris TaxID=36166 RepID=T1H3H5_MEGSC
MISTKIVGDGKQSNTSIVLAIASITFLWTGHIMPSFKAAGAEKIWGDAIEEVIFGKNGCWYLLVVSWIHMVIAKASISVALRELRKLAPVSMSSIIIGSGCQILIFLKDYGNWHLRCHFLASRWLLLPRSRSASK